VTDGSVAANLTLFRGVWLDLVAGFHPDGTPMTHDEHGPNAGTFPYQQLVYLDFDGGRLRQTNVVLRDREPHVRTFTGGIVDGVLVFDHSGLGSQGLEAPRTIGVSGGPGVLVFLPERVDAPQLRRFADPDYIRYLGGDQRTRTTTLYRDGELKRVLTVSGTRVHPDPTRRVSWDPRGPEGPVHLSPEEST